MTEPPTRSAPEPRGLMAVGAAGLVFEAIVVFLAAVAIESPGHQHSGAELGALLGLGAVLVAAAGLLRRRGGVAVASGVQVLVIAAGAFTWPMYVVGLIFALIWAYWLNLRRTAA